MQVMKGMIRSNALMLQKLLKQNSTGTVDEEALPLQLPLQTEQEIEEAEEKLKEKNVQKSLVSIPLVSQLFILIIR